MSRYRVYCGPTIVEQFVDGRAHRPPGVKDVIDQHDATSCHVERKRGGGNLGAESFAAIVIAIERHVDVADGVFTG